MNSAFMYNSTMELSTIILNILSGSISGYRETVPSELMAGG